MQRRICITEGYGWKVAVTGFPDWLTVSARVGEDQKSWFFIFVCDLICESSRCVAAWKGFATSVLCKLEHGTLAIWTS